MEGLDFHAERVLRLAKSQDADDDVEESEGGAVAEDLYDAAVASEEDDDKEQDGEDDEVEEVEDDVEEVVEDDVEEVVESRNVPLAAPSVRTGASLTPVVPSFALAVAPVQPFVGAPHVVAPVLGGGGGGFRHAKHMRRRRVLRDSLQSISKASIRRLARKGGTKRLSGLICTRAPP